MSALVRYFLYYGKSVAGYDKTPSALTSALIDEGADIHFKADMSLVPAEFREKEGTLVVFTPAVPSDHQELCWFRSEGYEVLKRSQVLGLITRDLEGLCVAGTHGKTTTSAMAAHILNGTPAGCNAFLGGISKNYKSNLLLSSASPYVVIEADEFDRSFHWLSPLRTVVTAMDADHLDIYGNYENYVESFRHYVSLIREGGSLIVHKGLEDKLKDSLKPGVRLYTYSESNGDYYAENIRIGAGTILFDYVYPGGRIADVELGVPVRINIDNGIAAMALAQQSGATPEQLKKGIQTFMGTDRRFDFHLRGDKVYLSDYAHHPAELEQCARSVSELYRDRKVTAIFQPHLYTRTRDFYKEFAASLSLFDRVYLVNIYPARERPIPGVSSQIIADCMKPGVCQGIVDKEDIPRLIESLRDDIEVLVTVGAGDLEDYVPRITSILKGEC